MRNNRKIMVAANWKEHFTVAQASHFLHRLQEEVENRQSVETVLFPNILTLQPLSVQLDRRKFRLGAQDGYYKDAGTYTGEVSMAMLRELVHYVLVGHSERRHIFNEGDDVAAKKVQAAARNGIMPILCIGETLPEKLAGETRQVLHNQLTSGLMHLTGREVGASVIAYEPVWAISDGHDPHPATPEDVQKSITYIRHQVHELFGPKAAAHVRILYGGSVDDHNAYSFLSLDGCDGALVGGASLHAHKFAEIVEVAFRIQQERTRG